jgi:simple sugar transport system substrate-binding protein
VTLDRRQLLKRLSAGAGVAALGGFVPEDAAAQAAVSEAAFPTHPRWKFVFVSQQTTNPLFVPLQYGIQDACDLVRCSYSWTGSASADADEVVKAVVSAVKSKSDGIAVPLVGTTAFDRSLAAATAAGIPLVGYHADAKPAERTVAFVGPNAWASGFKVGQRIAKLVRSGEVTFVVAERGTAPAERRLKGALAGLRNSGPRIRAEVLSTTRDPYEASSRVDRFVAKHKKLRGLFALELVSSEGVTRAAVKHGLPAKGVQTGGYGVLPATLKLIKQGKLAFTLDEQPYVQGFVPALQLFFAKLSAGLVAPADTELPLVFVTKANVDSYLAKTRFEGSSSKHRYPIR